MFIIRKEERKKRKKEKKEKKKHIIYYNLHFYQKLYRKIKTNKNKTK